MDCARCSCRRSPDLFGARRPLCKKHGIEIPQKDSEDSCEGKFRTREYIMSDLLSARSQMGLSLAFHIIFAVLGVSLPLMMTIAEGLWLRTREPVYLVRAKRWAKGAAILFAVGAVSGTVLSFELGLLWPRFDTGTLSQPYR